MAAAPPPLPPEDIGAEAALATPLQGIAGMDGDPAGSAQRPGVVARFAVDLTPLRVSKPFRRLWFGTAVSAIGSQITTVAIPFQLYELTGSTLLVGLLGLAALVPLLTVSFVGGAIADAADRRVVLVVGELTVMTASAALLANALLDQPRVWVLFAAEVVGTAGYALARPAMSAAVPRLVREEHVTAAIAAQSVYSSLAHTLGPALGGVLIASFGLATTYAIDLATFGASLAALALLPSMPPDPDAPRASLRSVLEGFRFVRTRPTLLAIFVVDTNAMIFGMPSALFPAFAEELGGGARTVGLLYSAPSAGALLASLVSGWIPRVRRQGLGVFAAAGLWGVAIAAVGFADALWLALLLLAAAGAADFVSAVLREAILIAETPDALRGRVSGIELAQVASAPALGNLEAGVVASLAGVRASIVSGGVLCVLGTLATAAALPVLLRYDARARAAAA